MRKSAYGIPLLTTTLASVLAAGCFWSEKGEGPIHAHPRTISAFDELEVDIPADITLVFGDSVSAVVTAQDNIDELIELKQSGGELSIQADKSYRSDKRVQIVLCTPNINRIELDGSGNILGVNPVKGNQLELELNGSGQIELEYHGDEVEANINGSGEIKLAGSSSEITGKINGSGEIKAKDLKCENAKINLTGSGSASIHAGSRIDAKITGSGNIHYSGDPEVNSKITGSGEVKKEN